MALFPHKIFNSRITNRKGFTLIEIVVATLIIVALSGGLFSAFWGAQRFLNRARHKIQAYNFAIEALDRLRSNYKYSDTEMNVANGYLASDIGCVISGEMTLLMPLGTDLTYDVTEPQVDGYKQVTIKAHWNEPSF